MSERFRDLVGAALGDENALGSGGALERWLAPTLESRIEQVPVEAVDDPQWRPDSTEPDPNYRALKSSVRASGVLQPLLLRPAGERYQLVSGARRLRAARETGQATVPAVIRELSDVEALLGAWDAVIRAGLSDAERDTVAGRLAGVGMTGAEVRALLSSVPTREPAEPPPPPRPVPAPYAAPDVGPRPAPVTAVPPVTPPPVSPALTDAAAPAPASAPLAADAPAAAPASVDLPAPVPDGPRPRVISIHLPPGTPGAAASPGEPPSPSPSASPSPATPASPAASAGSASPTPPATPASPAAPARPASSAPPAAPASSGPSASPTPAASPAPPSSRPAWVSYSPAAVPSPSDATASRAPSTPAAPPGWSVRPSPAREGGDAAARPAPPERSAWSPPASSAPPVSFGAPPAAAGAVTSPAVVPSPVLAAAGRARVAGRLARDPRTYATAGVFLAVWAVVFLIVAVVIGATNKTLLVFAVVVAAIGFITAIVGLALGPRRVS